MGTFAEYISSAFKNIISNRIRTLLTMLGIIIGIASVIAIITLGNGMADFAQEQLNSTGSNYMGLYLNTEESDAFFTNEDIAAIMEEYPAVKGGSFYFYNDGYAGAKKGVYDASVVGCNEYYYIGNSNDIQYGRYMTADEVANEKRVCVMMANSAKKLFGFENAVGMTVELNVNGRVDDFEVVGILKDYSDMIMQMMEMFGENLEIQVPYTVCGSLFNTDITRITYIEMYTDRMDNSITINTLARFLENRKGLRGQNAINYYDTASDSDELSNAMGMITTFMSIVAAISLLVGGIGVMNIMLVSVSERTREIGIRKAIGARTGSILFQFLAESSIISLMGGLIGVVLGLVIAAIVCRLIDFKFMITLSSILISALFSVGIGIFFGIYPARKAARLTPVEALSHRA